MFRRIFVTALIAGAVAGVFVWGAQMVKVTPLIQQAEVYEEALSQSVVAAGHSDSAVAAGHSDSAVAAGHEGQESAAAGTPEPPANGLRRNGLTLLADVLSAIGFALILTGAIALSGRDVDWRRGLFWGLAGFAVFYGAPSLGLAPELPGMQAAGLVERQIWWIGTVAATAIGLGAIFFVRRPALRIGGAALIVLPHIIGAPTVEALATPLPAELAAEFAVASLLTTGLFWLVLGGLAGHLYRRLDDRETGAARAV